MGGVGIRGGQQHPSSLVSLTLPTSSPTELTYGFGDCEVSMIGPGSKQMKTVTLASDGLYPPNKASDPFPTNLALAVLRQAFRDAIASERSLDRDWSTWRRDAIEWFFSSERQPGSFHWICSILQMEPWTLRRWLRTYQQTGSSRKAKMTIRLRKFRSAPIRSAKIR